MYTNYLANWTDYALNISESQGDYAWYEYVSCE